MTDYANTPNGTVPMDDPSLDDGETIDHYTVKKDAYTRVIAVTP